MKKLRGIVVLALFFAIFSPTSIARADDANPTASSVDNYLNLTTGVSPKQGLVVTNSTILNSNTGTFTIEAWVKPTDSLASTYGTIFLKQDSVRITLNSLKIDVALCNGSWSVYTTNAILRTNEWQHISVVKSGTTLYVYLNGTLVYQNAGVIASIASNTKYVGIGGDGWDGSTTQNSPQTNLFSGGIDEVKVWGVARTQSEVQSGMDSKIAGTSTNLLAYWDMNGSGSNTTIYDRTSNGINFTIFGAPTFPDIKTSAISGGNITYTFTRSYLNNAGGFQIPAGVTSVNALIVGGGGGGGFDGGGGGGGGGVYQPSNLTVTPGSSYSVVVGSGGPAINGYVGGTFCTGSWSNTAVGCLSGSGTGSGFGSVSASGGGGGGGIESNGSADSNSGANIRGGGGGGGSQNSKAGGSSGGAGAYAGGSSADTAGNAAGGGASSSAIGTSANGTLGGGGAEGVIANLNSTVYGSGGGGGSYNNTTVATGGTGAGAGGSSNTAATAPAVNRGGGGGGGGIGSGIATSGAAGLVIIKFALVSVATLSFATAPVYRNATSITATTNTASKVTFLANGKRIPGCMKVATNNLVATCSWKPAAHAFVVISIQVFPIDTNYASGIQSAAAVLPLKRTINR